jgi:hypothetical protein
MTNSICAFLNMRSGLGVGRKGGKESGVGWGQEQRLLILMIGEEPTVNAHLMNRGNKLLMQIHRPNNPRLLLS